MTMVKLCKEKKNIPAHNNYFKHYSLSVTNKNQIPALKSFKIFTSKSDLAVTYGFGRTKLL